MQNEEFRSQLGTYFKRDVAFRSKRTDWLSAGETEATQGSVRERMKQSLDCSFWREEIAAGTISSALPVTLNLMCMCFLSFAF
jgi:hypothetical protein